MKSPCFPAQEAVAPTCPQISALLLISCSWRALPVPTQLVSTQSLKAVGLFERDDLCVWLWRAQKDELFQHCKLPWCSWLWGEGRACASAG